MSVGDSSGIEHVGAQGAVDLPLTLSDAATAPVTVSYYSVDGTAKSGSDFTRWGTQAQPRTITIPAGSRRTTISVPVSPDSTTEADEQFTVVVAGVTTANAVVGRSTGTATIKDSSLGSFVSSPSIVEGDSGTVVAQFRVEFASTSASSRTVGYSTANGTAVAPGDYTAKSPTSLVFAAGQASKTVDVTVGSNTTYQGDRGFVLNTTGAMTTTGTATILEDDPEPPTTTTTTVAPTTTTTTTTVSSTVPAGSPVVSVGDSSGIEHVGAQGAVDVPLTLSASIPAPVTVSYYSVDGTAKSGSDFTRWGTPSQPRTITIASGARRATISVPVTADSLAEADEQFTVVVAGVTTANAFVGRSTGTATIKDSSTGYLVSSPTVVEGDSGTVVAQFRVELATAPAQSVTVNYATANGTATAPGDYTAKPSTSLTFAAGQTSKSVDVTVNSNSSWQGDRSFSLNVTGGFTASGTATILDDDPQPSTTTTALPAAPVAGDDSVSTAFNTAITDGTTRGNDSGTGTLTTTLVGDTTHGTLVLAADGTFTYTPATGFSGIDTFTYKVTDGYAQDSATATVTITVAAATPTVTSISPASGTTAGGTTVVITGTYLNAASAVTFGSTAAASYTVDSATQITATSPSGDAGDVSVTVTTAGGTTATSSATTYTFLTPTTTTTVPATEKLSAGNDFSCAVLADSTARCWGFNIRGQLGNNTTTDSKVPVTVVDPANTANALTGIASISVGSYSACAVITDGTARCWGWNAYGQLGNNTTSDSNVAVTVADPANTANALTGIASISVGSYSACAVMTDSTARCWGKNDSGQLGNNATIQSCVFFCFGGYGNNTQSKVPVTVVDPTNTANALTGIASISRGGDSRCALMIDGTARCWGSNNFGQLGNNSGTRSSVPVTVVDPANTANALTGIASISTSPSFSIVHTCAVLTDGTAKCWGFNLHGQLGNEDGNMASGVPVTVNDPANTANALTRIASISAGDGFTCAVLTDGTARCWGWNGYGQLGNNTTTSSLVPVTVLNPSDTTSALTGIARIAAGLNHACAWMTDGTARCWGLNDYGNLGNNTNTQSNVPVTVIGLG